MNNIPRILHLDKILKRKSLFLFGPRQTGKTTFLKKHFPEARYIDLLDLEEHRQFSIHPEALEVLTKNTDLVIIDEIQKMPELLNEVQKLLTKRPKQRFILTGSSARKLKRSSANLLGGRATEIIMRPLSLFELNINQKNFDEYLIYGGLPFLCNSDSKRTDLKDYASLYLTQEIKEEGLVRNFSNFSRFLYFAATVNTEQINYTSLGSDASLPPRTVQDYFQILEDTLVGIRLKPFQKSKRKTVNTDKFYFFDVGVCNFLREPKLSFDDESRLGTAFEHLIFSELYTYICCHSEKYLELFYWRTHTQLEVDYILKTENEIIAIESKFTKKVKREHFNGLKAFADEYPKAKKFLVCQVKNSYEDDSGVYVINVLEFLEKLWKNDI